MAGYSRQAARRLPPTTERQQLQSAVEVSLDGFAASPLVREPVCALIPLVARMPSNVLHPRSPFFGPLEARPCLPRGLRHRLMFFGLPNSGRDVCCVHGVISDADWLAVGKAVRVRPVNSAGECYQLGEVAGGGQNVRVLAAACVDLAALLVQLAAVSVFRAGATCNRLESVARRWWGLAQLARDRTAVCVDGDGVVWERR